MRHESIKAFKKAMENRNSKISPYNEDRPPSRSGSATRGYTGHQPKHDDYSTIDLPSSPTKYKIRGYTGHIPGSAFVCGTPLVPSEEIQHEMINSSGGYDSSSPQRRKALGTPTCKYRSETGSLMFPHKEEITIHGNTLRPGHKEFIHHRYGSVEELNLKYDTALRKLQSRGQTPIGLLRIVQSQLSQRVVNYSQQFIRLRKMFEYFDFDDSCTLDEYEFKHFLELNNLYFDGVQLAALFAHLDEERIGGIPWSIFSSCVMVPNPRGGTAVLPKAIIRDSE
jgi:hypothetical protein